MNNVNYNIYSIRTYNNDALIFYNSTKRKKISDILSSYKTRYKRFQNHKDNWLNVFYLLQQDKTYIKIEEQLTNSNDEIVKSRLCDYIAKNECINKLNIHEINNLCNKEREKENQIVLYEEPIKEPIKEEIIKTINEIKKDKEIKLIEEPKILTKLYDDDYLYNDKNFEPSKDNKTIIKKLEDIKNFEPSCKSNSSSSSLSSITDYITNIKKTKNVKSLKNKINKNRKNLTLKNIR